LHKHVGDIKIGVLTVTNQAFESYLKNVEIQKLLEELDVPNPKLVFREIKHFTQKEAETTVYYQRLN